MTTIHTILEEFRQLATSMPDLGGKFERLIKSYLLTDPTYKNLYSEVSLWNEWQYKWSSDTGIDLVAIERDTGDYCAIQCKFYDPNRTLQKGDIDSFFTTSGRRFMTREGEKSFNSRLFVSTTDKWSKHAAEALNNQLIPVNKLQVQDLENSKIDWSKFSVNHPQDIVLKPKNPIRPHQQTAVEKVAVSFETADRGKLIMACGTGKTFTSLKIAEKITPENSCILFLVPSISLLAQTLREWQAEANTPLHCSAVCSDDKVGKKADNEDIGIHDLAFPATTNAHDLSKHLSAVKDKRMVIFSTYQSIQVIADAQQQGLPEFDLIICDEAHRTTGITLDGKNEAHFVKVHDQDFIKAKKRLYMTATPRIFSAAIKAAAEERSVVIACMDNEQFFGQVFHHLTFKQAIADQLLTDYKVVIVGVDAPMIKAWIDQREFLKTDSGIETDAQTFAAHIGLMKVMRDYDLKRVISFHSRIKRAEDFAKEYDEMLHWVKAEHKPSGEIVTDYVSGKMNVADRTHKINQLKTIDDKEGMTGRMLLANARCLSEGIDVPDLDGVAFIDPRKSQVDIVQAVGRAIRKSNSKTHGIIVLPVFIGDGDNPQTELENSRYEPIWKVLDALRSHDDVLAEELDNFRTELGRDKSGSSGGFSKIVIDLPATVGNGFVNALKARIIEVTTVPWLFWHGLLLDYVAEFGHSRVPLKFEYEGFNLGSWVSTQRVRKNKLGLERVQQLEELLQWSWDVIEDQWSEIFNTLKKYIEEHGHMKIPRNLKYEGCSLGNWIRTQRTIKDKLSPEKKALLESLPQWSWNPLEDQWNDGFSYLKKYVEEYGHARVAASFKYKKFNLGIWVSRQRKVKNNFNQEIIQLFESLPEWSWNALEDKWNEGFNYLKKYVAEQGHARVPNIFKYDGFNLGTWVATQRHGKCKLDLKKIQLLEELPQWSWNPLEDQWNEGFEYLKKYVEKYGNAKVPLRFKDENFNLGWWVSTQRQTKDKLGLERVQQLEELLQWSWDVLEDQWNEGFEYLKKYVEKYGHAKVPAKFKYQNFNLGTWASWQRNGKNKLSPERIKKLELLPQWSWK